MVFFVWFQLKIYPQSARIAISSLERFTLILRDLPKVILDYYQLVDGQTHFTRLEPTVFTNLKDTVSSSLKHYANLHPCVSTSITWQSSIRIGKL